MKGTSEFFERSGDEHANTRHSSKNAQDYARGSVYSLGAQLGPVSVRLLTNCRSIFSDYAAVNRNLLVREDANGFQVTVLIERRRSWSSGMAHYHISGAVEESFTVRKRARVVPYIDGMINLTVARDLPDYVQLHAAVLQRGSIGLVIPGGPGFGKTTLAAALIKRGWNYASDEFALIDPNTIELAPFPKSLSIKPGSVALLENQGINIKCLPRFHRVDKGAIRCLSADRIRPNALAKRVRPRMVVFPQVHNDVQPAMHPISSGPAVMHCLQRCFNFPRWGAVAMETVAQMCERSACFELISGDLAQTCSLIDAEASRLSECRTFHQAALSTPANTPSPCRLLRASA